MREGGSRKIEVFIITTIFLGAATIPNINANTQILSNSEDSVVITVELCGIDKLPNIKDKVKTKYSVELSKEEASHLQSLIDEIKQNLNNVETRDETFKIFNDAVESFHDLGLLEDGISVRDAQYLVSGINDSSTEQDISIIFEDLVKLAEKQGFLPDNMTEDEAEKTLEIFEKIIMSKISSLTPFGKNKNRNLFCLIAGETTNTVTAGPLYHGLYTAYLTILLLLSPLLFIASLLPYDYLSCFLEVCMVGIVASLGAYAYFSNLNPAAFSNIIGIGKIFDDGIHVDSHPGKGWITTIGLNGKKTYEGSMYGTLRFSSIIGYPNFLYYYPPAAIGFTGIKITTEEDKNKKFYLGTSLLTNVGRSRWAGMPKKTVINGPITGVLNKEYTYNISSSDPENDDLYYIVDWGDKQETYGPYPSNKTISTNHSWKEIGSYDIKAFAVSNKFEIGQCSDPLSIKINKERNINHPVGFNNLLLKILRIFPIINKLLATNINDFHSPISILP